MGIVSMFRYFLRQQERPEKPKMARIFPKRISSIESEIKIKEEVPLDNCPHSTRNRKTTAHISQLEPLDFPSVKLIYMEGIVNRNPSVRLFFRTGDETEQTPIVTGRMISAEVMEVPNLPDVIDIVIRIPSDQAAKLPFVEVHLG